ncbi:MAG: hypothetical protein QOF84_1201 [Streptomyces sp.]|nr:hypothetical protein [Streptomyces sp.]
MITIIENTIKMTDRPVVAACPLGGSLRGSGVSGRLSALSLSAAAGVVFTRERSERPTQAPAVAAAAAQAQAYAFAAKTNGAGNNGNQKTQNHPKWASRGLEPWSDPV